MKKLCFLLAVFLLVGCGKTAASTQTVPTDAVAENPWVSFDIYAINDLHGKLADTEAQPGVDELSTYLKEAADGQAILLSTGDMWQGSSESNLTNGQIITRWMNQLGFAAMTLGGHEFDWGEEWIASNHRLAEFPFLGINIYSRETGKQVDYCQSSVVLERDGVQIGVIGAIGDCYSSIAPEQVKDVFFKTGEELTALVIEEAKKLREEGVDFIIYSLHDGYDENIGGTKPMAVTDSDLKPYYDPVLSEVVDLVFEGDTHYWYVLEDSQGVYHLQGGGNNHGIAHAQVLIHKYNGVTSVATAELLSNSKYSYLEDDPSVEALLEEYGEQIAPGTKELGSNGQYRTGSDLCQLVAELYCAKGMEKWGEEYDIVLGGGYLSCRSPGYLPEGRVRYSQLQSLLPFDNEITLCSIRGRDLAEKFLETENPAYYIETTDYGETLRAEIDPQGTYYVVTDRYTADYAPNNMMVLESYGTAVFARDLVAQYIAAGGLE